MIVSRPAVATVLVSASLAAALVRAAGQNTPKFDVTSVKENTNITAVPSGRLLPDGGIIATRVPPLFCILLAFQLQPDQVVGAPGWLGTAFYDIQAKPAAAATRRDTFAMLQALLQDRFHLQFHRESRQLSIYALVRGRSDGGLGPRFRQSVADCVSESPRCDYGGGVSAHIQTDAISMDILTALLSNATGRVVVDRTGLNGGFAIDLEWSPDQSAVDKPSLFTAVQEQLGLKLESTKGPVDVLVIDHIERPTPD